MSSNRSGRICVDYGDRIESIFVSQDAHTLYTGKLLLNVYNNEADIIELFKLGYIRKLHNNIRDTRENRYGIERNIFKKTDDYAFEDLLNFYEHYKNDNFRIHIRTLTHHHLYMWRDNQWYYCNYITQFCLTPLTFLNRNIWF